MKAKALLLTSYEKYGEVGMDEYREMFINDLDISISMVSDYNEWLDDTCCSDERIYDADDLEMLLEGMSAYEAFRLGAFSDGVFTRDYIMFDGYGNLHGLYESEVLDLLSNKDFLEWYIEWYNLIDEDEAEEVIEEANKLIEEGY